MTADPLYRDPALAAFYDLENGWAADFEFCTQLAAAAGSVLDLGCGTGMLAAALAPGRRVVGVDPAAAMLDIARLRPGGNAVRWVEADVRSLDLGERFDLVVMTGHAFQVFLGAEDRAAALAAVARHLAPGGRYIFDSRNPDCAAWRAWGPDESRRRLDGSPLGPVAAWNDARWDAATGIVTYRTVYETADGRRLEADARIAFPPRAEIAAALADAGLGVERWLGSWAGEPWRDGDPEIIPLGGLLNGGLPASAGRC
ncbi:methyltransferase [Allostella sp. ATCC 35155]|nr:methyltransferase [Stella sp. ATCC 35155]